MIIKVITDYNDGDYVDATYKITKEEWNSFIPIIDAIKNFVPYPYKFGICYNNFNIGWCCRKDLYERDAYLTYPDVSKKLLSNFIQTLLINNKYDGGFHDIEEISNVETGEVYFKRDYIKLFAYANTDPALIAYLKEKDEIKQKWADLCGCDVKSVHSFKFDDMTPEAYNMYLKYCNVWRKYRDDLDDEFYQ